MTTKAQEREALEQIKAIVEGLGKDSYVGTAFEGCFEIAEENIENDSACSMKQRAESAEAAMNKCHKNSMERKQEIEKLQKENERLVKENEKLKADLDKELGWHDCEGGTNMRQDDYIKLEKFGRTLTESEAKKLVENEFGFYAEFVSIVTEVSTYEANKYHRMRKKETFARSALYDATDYNYVRFDVRAAGATWQYEMVNGMLRPYEC